MLVSGLYLASEPEIVEIFFKKDLSKSAHADAADTDEMDMKRFMKVYLIHNNLLIYMLFLMFLL